MFVFLGIITHNQIYYFKYCSILRVLFPVEIDRDYSRLPVVRRLFHPWAVRAIVYGDVWMCLYLLLGLPYVVM